MTVTKTRVVVQADINVDKSEVIANIKSALARDLKPFLGHEYRKGIWAVAAGGPSLKDSIQKLRAFKRKKGAKVVACGGAYRYLLDHGVVADYHIILDAKPGNVRFVEKTHPKTKFLIASQVNPAVFDELQRQGRDIVLWHCGLTTVPEAIETVKEVCGDTIPWISVVGGCSVGLHALTIGWLSGYKRYELFGFDSSYSSEDKTAHHPYPQERANSFQRLIVDCQGKEFVTAVWMIGQVQDFGKWLEMYHQPGFRIKIHGDGFLKHAVCAWGENGWNTDVYHVARIIDKGVQVKSAVVEDKEYTLDELQKIKGELEGNAA